MTRALVQNAGDAAQVRKAARSERWLRERQLNDMRAIIAMPEGRRVFWFLLGQCKVNASIMETNARIYYNAGRQDFGHFLIEQITHADEWAWIAMQREAKQEADPTPEPSPVSDEE